MVQLRKINPMVRAVGTMGAVAAVAGGITFAALTSNSVALSANTLSSATAHLLIGNTKGDNCANAGTTAVQGMDVKLKPGVKSDDFNFCLKNDGDVPLDLTASVVQADLVDSAIPAGDVTLDIACGDAQGASDTLNKYTGDDMIGTVAAGDSVDCTANATLASDYNGSGTSVKPFTINFVGTQSDETGTGTGTGSGNEGTGGTGSTGTGDQGTGSTGTSSTGTGTGTNGTGSSTGSTGTSQTGSGNTNTGTGASQ
jgi:hypothetical protein